MNNLLNSDMNRRESFRFVDTVALRVRLLDADTLANIVHDFQTYRLRYCTKSHVQNIKEIRKPRLMKIRKISRDVADYLESLEDQIATLAERMDQSEERSADTVEFTDKVDLSATGIRFRTDMNLSVEDNIEIGMMLSAYNTQVLVLGEVLRVEERSDEKVAVSVKYTHIHQDDTEAIIRHLAKVQQLELQTRRDSEADL